MPGCDFTRRDFLRWTGRRGRIAVLRPAGCCVNGVERTPGHEDGDLARQPRAGDAHRGPGGHHLVHGLHGDRRRPRPHGARAGRRRGALGHRPEPAEPGRRQPERHDAVPLRRAAPASSRAGPTTTKPVRTGSSCRRRRSRSSPATRSARRTSGSPPAARTASPCPSRRRAASCSRSRCATTCTWARRPPGSRRHPEHQGHPAGARPARRTPR